MATQGEMSREDKRFLYDIRELLMLPDAELRKNLERLARKISAGMTKEDIAWVEKQIAEANK